MKTTTLLPSYYLIDADDKMIPPAAQRFMSKRADADVIEERGSHAIYVSHPKAVASLIKWRPKTQGLHAGLSRYWGNKPRMEEGQRTTQRLTRRSGSLRPRSIG